MRSRLMTIATGFVLIYSIIITLSPAVRYHSWAVSYKWTHWVGAAIWIIGFSILYRRVRHYLPDSDPYIFAGAALLTGWGLLTIWRLTPYFGIRQTIWLAISLAILWFAIKKPAILDLLHRYKYLWLTGMLLLTALTFLIGTYPNGEGPNLWLGWGLVYFQPSEALKLLMIIYMAAYLADRMPTTIGLLQLISPSLILIGAATFLLIAQRDLGTASLLIVIYTLIIYLATGKRRILPVATLLLVAAGISGYELFDVIKLRMDAWVNPWLDSGGRSYQIVQSIMSFAAGGLLGSGPGLGSPGVVPVAHSDFIFAAIGEETGLIGASGLVLILGIMTMRGLRIALSAPDIYRRILAGGISVYIVVQSILIMGGTLRLLPLTGVTLPFVSYGGTSLLFSFIALLILLLISNQVEEQPAPHQRTTPYIVTGSLIFVSLFALILIQGWWAIVRAPGLAVRPDNPRRAISDRYVIRGRLLDRSNEPLADTQGAPGDYSRLTIEKNLGPVIGYNSATYGQSGLEAGLDDHLRGLRGYPNSTIWITQVLYTQAPPGLDVRLSIEKSLQSTTDNLLVGSTGALILLNARSGEIYVMSSAPTFDPNQLEGKWETWIKDDQSPLVNRPTQGLYPIGTALGPFLLSSTTQVQNLPQPPASLQTSSKDRWLNCAIPPVQPDDWGAIIQSGCPGANLTLSNTLTSVDIRTLYDQLGFDDNPVVPLASAVSVLPQTDFSVTDAVIGEDGLRITPLQMSLAAAALSNHGVRPAPRLAIAVNTPHQGWVLLPAEDSIEALPQTNVDKIVKLLAISELPVWESLSNAYTEDGKLITWYIGGTLPDWNGTPMAIALVLENSTPQEAQRIGRLVLKTALNP